MARRVQLLVGQDARARSRVEVIMVAAPFPARPLPGLPPYEPDRSLSLGAACRLGLVPGHDGRRAAPVEISAWARVGFPIRPFGPRYLFPAVVIDGRLRTTVEWCEAWVRFVALVQAAEARRRSPTPLHAKV